MSTISLGRSGILGISYKETSLLKSSLKRASEKNNSAINKINRAKLNLQVDRGSSRIRIESDNLQSLYRKLKNNNTDIEKAIKDIEYIVRRFKEVDNKCANKVKLLRTGLKVQKSASKIGSSLISLGDKVIKRTSSFIEDGKNIIKSDFKNVGQWNKELSKLTDKIEDKVTKAVNLAKLGLGIFYIGKSFYDSRKEKEESYLVKSRNQIIYGNYTDDVTMLGTGVQIGTGILGVDFPADARDISADVVNWQWSWRHAGQTVLDLAALIPVVGALKYSDEAEALLKNSDEFADAVKAGSKEVKINVEEVIPPGAQNTVKVYTDGYAQVNKGKIEIYIRGKIPKPSNYDEIKDRISELTKLKKKNPSEFTIEMDKELKAADKIVHNYDRSKAMGDLLDDADIADTVENNEKIAKIILDSAKEVTPKNTKIKSTINIGNKPVIVESWWIVDKNGMSYCSTIILIEVK